MTDKKSESLVNAFGGTYLPRDEVFEGARKEALDVERLKGITRNLIPYIRTCVTKCGAFKQLSDIQKIYKTKHLHELRPNEGTTTKSSFPTDVSKIQDAIEEYFKFNIPHIMCGT